MSHARPNGTSSSDDNAFNARPDAVTSHDENLSLLADDPLADNANNANDAQPTSPRDATVDPTDKSQRSASHVRFDLNPAIIEAPRLSSSSSSPTNSTARGILSSFDIEDPLDFDDDGHAGDNRHPRAQRYPLLTDIEAPSVTLANTPWGDEDVHEWADQELGRPKSGLRMAFMNMANSIIGAGIIGQPYAFHQAGLLAGTVLLVGLTFVVDWTICLIVINTKLSGSNSFQGTVERCFGRPGLIAISLAQWLFAFGGMVAFCVIVGDSIPHVLTAIWPGLRDIPVLGLLANRRVVIAVFVLGISYPLSLYRDIAKV